MKTGDKTTKFIWRSSISGRRGFEVQLPFQIIVFAMRPDDFVPFFFETLAHIHK